MSVFAATYRVSFGDCDPAGIVFYPNLFAWLDRTFHSFLAVKAGGHAAICAQLNAKGIGLTDAACSFRAPVTEGDALTIAITEISWESRTFTLAYDGQVGGKTHFQGSETRALFVQREGRLRAGDISALRTLLGAD
ncbi:MAG: acyl-CoA thioesterase [Pseudomonadota bacterium]